MYPPGSCASVRLPWERLPITKLQPFRDSSACGRSSPRALPSSHTYRVRGSAPPGPISQCRMRSHGTSGLHPPVLGLTYTEYLREGNLHGMHLQMCSLGGSLGDPLALTSKANSRVYSNERNLAHERSLRRVASDSGLLMKRPTLRPARF